MNTKITVNGVSYDGLDSMPPEARRLYERTLAELPELADRDGDGVPDIVQGPGSSARVGTTIRTKIVVNGTTYQSEAEMPPDVREAYERAKRAMGTPSATTKRNAVTMSFQISGPGFSFGNGSGTPDRSRNRVALPASASEPFAVTPAPIEPRTAGGGVRMALILAAFVAGGLLVWLMMRAR